MDVVIRKPEMMTDLVNEDVRHEPFQRFIARRPFLEDRTPEQANAFGQCAGLADAPLGQRHAFIKPAEVVRVMDSKGSQRSPVREIFDNEHDIIEAVRKGRRQP